MASRLRGNDRLMLAGVVFFGIGATLLLTSIRAGSNAGFVAGLASIVVAVALFAIAAFRIWTRVDWQRVDAEQRLWQSGPLGRRWLRLRKLLSGEARPREDPHE
ncbi:MAG: hypothetical protein PVH00_14530 [Gemmatimonadota bacterium]|jgi:hypothetical protein